MTQIEAVSSALTALGPEASPREVSVWVKKHHDVNIKPGNVSNIKWALKGRMNGHAGLSADDLLALKSILTKVGGDELTRVIEVLK